MPENEGSEAKKRTKMAILCSGEQEIGIGKPCIFIFSVNMHQVIGESAPL